MAPTPPPPRSGSPTRTKVSQGPGLPAAPAAGATDVVSRASGEAEGSPAVAGKSRLADTAKRSGEGLPPSRGSLHGGGGNWLERGVGPARQWSWPDVHHRWAERERRGWSWEGSESQGNMEHSWASRSGLHPPSPTQGSMGSRCASWEGGAARRELSTFSAATLGAWPRTMESLPGLASPWDAAPVCTVGAL